MKFPVGFGLAFLVIFVGFSRGDSPEETLLERAMARIPIKEEELIAVQFPLDISGAAYRSRYARAQIPKIVEKLAHVGRIFTTTYTDFEDGALALLGYTASDLLTEGTDGKENPMAKLLGQVVVEAFELSEIFLGLVSRGETPEEILLHNAIRNKLIKIDELTVVARPRGMTASQYHRQFVHDQILNIVEKLAHVGRISTKTKPDFVDGALVQLGYGLGDLLTHGINGKENPMGKLLGEILDDAFKLSQKLKTEKVV